jgi:hypothetical protein
VVRTWSERNCFENLNPVEDADGKPRFFLRESVLDLNTSRNLSHTCRYGPDADQFVTQIRRQGLVQNVDAFQVLYAEDLDGDRLADRWITAGQWSDPANVTGLQLVLLLTSNDSVSEPRLQTYNLFEQTISSPADGKLRRVFTLTHHFRSKP